MRTIHELRIKTVTTSVAHFQFTMHYTFCVSLHTKNAMLKQSVT